MVQFLETTKTRDLALTCCTILQTCTENLQDRCVRKGENRTIDHASRSNQDINKTMKKINANVVVRRRGLDAVALCCSPWTD